MMNHAEIMMNTPPMEEDLREECEVEHLEREMTLTLASEIADRILKHDYSEDYSEEDVKECRGNTG
jgi:hypothetical protein